jgi:hypothetical protein
MANRWKGNFIVATEATSSGTAYTGKANGAWSLNNQIQQKQANLWAKGVGAPTTPTIGTATAGNANASVTFTASSDAGASGSLTYTATSTPGSFTNTGSSSPIVVSGLTNGTQYTFKVNATNSLGYMSPDSAASNSTGTTVPGAPTIGTATGLVGSVSITFTPPANTGDLTITGYTATSSPGSITGTSTSSPVSVTGLTVDTNYTFTVVATNAIGNSLPSAASNSATPLRSYQTLLSTSISQTPNIVAYKFLPTEGFATKYTDVSTSVTGSPKNIIGDATNGLVFTANQTTAPNENISAYQFSNAGWGTKYSSNIGNTVGNANAVSYSSTSNLIAFSGSTSPYISVYPFTYASGFGTRYANPSSAITSFTAGCGLSANGNELVVATDDPPYVYAYQLSAGAVGTKYANPATASTGSSRSFRFNSNKTVLVLGLINTVAAYNWTTGVGFGTKYTAPGTITVGQVLSSTFNSSNNVLFLGGNTPGAQAYAWSSGFGSKYTDPSITYAGFVSSLSINPTENSIYIANNTSVGNSAYGWSNSTGFGTKYVAPSSDSLISQSAAFVQF